MTDMTGDELRALVLQLRKLPKETEWVEFKQNWYEPEQIGEYLSALSNGACLQGKAQGFLVWGIDDESHTVVGTTFNPNEATANKSREDLYPYLARHLTPPIEFQFFPFYDVDGKFIVVLAVDACYVSPTCWQRDAYVRVGSHKKKLAEYPELSRKIWAKLSRTPFEKRIARDSVTSSEVLDLLNYDAYFQMTKKALPTTTEGILDVLCSEKMAAREEGAPYYQITNLGALLFARHLPDFEKLERKAVRVIDYAGTDRLSSGNEKIFDAGYAASFIDLIDYIKSRLPNNEQIEQALRFQTQVYPEVAIREFVANAIIHQDLDAVGDSPLIQIFMDRMEVTNPGLPLIDPLRFINEPPQSRNESLAKFMRRLNICEERGSGIDRAVAAIEVWQLPAPEFLRTENHMRIHMYAKRPFSEMTTKDRVRACFQHVCLMYEFNKPATNASLRQRFSFGDDNYKVVTKIIAATLKEKLIKPYDPDNKSPRYARYVPIWT